MMISTCPKCEKPVSIPAGVDSSAAVRCPLCSAEYALSETVQLPTPPELIPVGLPDTQPSPTDAASFAGEAQQEPEEENEAAAVAERFPAMPVAARRKRKPKSALQTMIEVVAGGLAGCLVAYYALAFYYGPEFGVKGGLPKLPLPGIEWITSPRAVPEQPKDAPADKKPAKSESGGANQRN